MSKFSSITIGLIAVATSGTIASPFATSVLSYDQGSNAADGFTLASTALGSAERFTGESVFGGAFASAISPFNPAFGPDELVSVGSGGHLSLGFDRLITNDASHAYGVDLIVFSNAGFSDATYTDDDLENDGTGFTGANPFIFGAGGAATIQVSQDGFNWFTAAVTQLNLFPTLGYSDLTETTSSTPGSVETDFTQALDPTLSASDMVDMSLADLIQFYDGSGGGIGIDIASTGLSSASYVRFLNESGEAFEVDAVAVVPAPGTLFAFGLVGVGAIRRRR